MGFKTTIVSGYDPSTPINGDCVVKAGCAHAVKVGWSREGDKLVAFEYCVLCGKSEKLQSIQITDAKETQ